MTLYADKRVILRHAAPVVRHADKRDAAVLDFKSDLPGTGVNRVFKKLLYGRCRKDNRSDLRWLQVKDLQVIRQTDGDQARRGF